MEELETHENATPEKVRDIYTNWYSKLRLKPKTNLLRVLLSMYRINSPSSSKKTKFGTKKNQKEPHLKKLKWKPKQLE